MTAGAIIKLRDRFVETVADDEILLMRNDTGELLSLSGSAAAVWRLIDGLRDRRALLEALNSHFSAVPPIPSEIEEFLSELKEMGLIGHG